VAARRVDAGALHAEHIRQLALGDGNPSLLAVGGMEARDPFRQALQGRMPGVAGGLDPKRPRARRGIGGEKLVNPGVLQHGLDWLQRRDIAFGWQDGSRLMSMEGRADSGLPAQNAAGRNHAHADPLLGRKEAQGAVQDEIEGVVWRRLARPQHKAPRRLDEDSLNLRRQGQVDGMILEPRPGARRRTPAPDIGVKSGHVLIQ
jgi:hypothetical protein